MNGDVVARARSVVNPFVVNRVDSAWDAGAVDVEGINHTAFQRCLETIRLVRDTGQSRGLVLAGEPGSGKTHLLQRLRRYLQNTGSACFVYAPAMSGPDRFFKDLLRHTVQDLVGARTGSATSQLETVLVRRLLTAGTVSPTTFWNNVRRRNPPGEPLFAWLEAPVAQLCIDLQLDPDVAQVLRHYLAEHRRFEAYSWLLGRSVPEVIVERLGVGQTLEEDADALRAFASIARLAGEHAGLVVTFDQLEALQNDAHDRQGLRAFATGIVNLFQACSNVATVSCMQTYFFQDLKFAVSEAELDRIAQDQGALTKLQPATAFELVGKRLAVVPEVQAAREALRIEDALWPLCRADVVQVVPADGIPARQLLNHCRDLFEGWRRGEPVSTNPPETLEEVWETRVEQAGSEPADEGVLVDGMVKMLDVRQPGRVRRGGERDVDLVIRNPDGEIGVAVCHAENMTSLAARLRRLQSSSVGGRFKRLVLIRDQRLPISATARTTWQRIDDLKQAGHILLRPSAEVYAALAAARRLLAEAAAGDLSINGQVVPPADVKTWLAGNLSQAAVELLDAVGGVAGLQRDDFLEQVQAFLDGQWVMPATEISSTLSIDETTLVARLATQQRVIGVLSGPPAVLFLRSDGVRRE